MTFLINENQPHVMQEMNYKVKECPNAPTNKAPKPNFMINLNVDPNKAAGGECTSLIWKQTERMFE